MSHATPDDLLAGHPSTAYFWGRVAGHGEVTRDRILVVTHDADAAATIAQIAGSDVAHDTNTRDYAHDADSTRTEDEYTVEVTGEARFEISGGLGLPVDRRGNYRFGAVSAYSRDLLRGLLEGCGTICFKSASGTVGISFVHDDPALLGVIQQLIENCPVDAPYGDCSESATGGFWFGVADDAAADFGLWLYERTDETGLFAPSRRRKLVRSLDQAPAVDVDRAQFDP